MAKAISLSMLLFLISCKEANYININKVITKEENSFQLEFKFKKVEYKIIDSKLYSFVKGTVIITNKANSNVNINLKDYVFFSDKAQSDIYIDSVASVLITDEILKSKTSVEKTIYIAFDIKITNENVSELKLLLKGNIVSR